MKRIYPVWMIITVGLFALGVVFAGANIETFLDLPSLFIVVFPSTLMLLTCFGWDEIAGSFRAAYHPGEATPGELDRGILLFQSWQRFFGGAGAVAFLIGIIVTLANLEEASTAGFGLSLSLMSVFYAVVIGYIFTTPFRIVLQKARGEISE